MSLPTALGLVLLCLCTEAFFSGSEIALVSADRMRLRTLAAEGDRGARLALALLDRPARLLATCLVGTNLSTVSAATVASLAAMEALGRGGEGLAAALLFPLILVFGELTPKRVFQFHADRLAPRLARPVRVAQLAFLPVVTVLDIGARLLLRLTGSDPNGGLGLTRTLSREDIQLRLTARSAVDLDEQDRRFIQRVFAFTEATVHDAMVPLIDVVMVPETATVADAIERIEASGHSWLPVFRERVDNVIGVVYHLDLLLADDLGAPVTRFLRPVRFVPESKRVDELFLEFRKERGRLAIVVDEYGGAVGLVTREDILEELVGEIHDEHDPEAPGIQRVGPATWEVSGRVEREPLREATTFEFPEGDYETLAGFLLSELGHVPRPGESVVHEGWRLEVIDATDRAIRRVRLAAPPHAARVRG